MQESTSTLFCAVTSFWSRYGYYVLRPVSRARAGEIFNEMNTYTEERCLRRSLTRRLK